jgi:hypothetical protein
MDWYCSLTEHLLERDNIVVGKESFQSVQQQLEKASSRSTGLFSCIR